MPFKSDFYKKVTLRKEHTKYLSIPFIFICAYYIAKYFLIAAYGTTLGDFGVYYYIPKAVLELARPEHPYTNFTPIYPYFFPPASIPLFKILLFFPYYLAKYIWTILNFSLILGSLYLMFDYFNKKIDWTYFFLLSISLAFHPTQFTLREGQFNIVMLFIFTIVLWGIKKNKSIKPGILLGIGVVTKISPALLLIYAMYKKHYKLAFIAILTILSLTILAEIKVKKGINFYYLSHVMADVSTQSKGINNRDQSILGLVKKIDFKDPKIHIAKKTLSKDNIRSLISYSIVGTFLAIYLLADLYKKSKKNTEIDYAILLIIGVIGTGLTWFHQYTMLLLALYILFFVIQKIENKNNKILAWGVFFISYFLMFRTSSFYQPGGKLLPQINLILGGFIMLILFLYLKVTDIKLKTSNKRVATTFEKKNLLYLVFLVSLSGVFLFTLNSNPVEYLKQGRDRARIKATNTMGKALQENKPGLLKGESNSYIKSQKLDEGFVMFKKQENNKVRSQLSILLLDPINNSEYNINFKSEGKKDFILSTKLESQQYKNSYGELYRVSCKENYTECEYPNTKEFYN